MAKTLTGAAMAEKYLRNAQNAGKDWETGIQNPKRDPVKAAVAAAGKYKDNMEASLKEDRWVNSMKRLDSATIIAKALKVGGAGYARGISNAADKVKAAFDKLAPILQTHSDRIQSMPNATQTDRENRMLENFRGMIKVGEQFRKS